MNFSTPAQPKPRLSNSSDNGSIASSHEQSELLETLEGGGQANGATRGTSTLNVGKKHKEATLSTSIINSFSWGDYEFMAPEALNKKALAVVNKVREKLTGRDFDPSVVLEINEQVELLIQLATDHENLAQCYIGWCPFW